MGSTLTNTTAVNKCIMKNGPSLTRQQQVKLCSPVTDQEIYDGLWSIEDNKAPGVDGNNTLFILKKLGQRSTMMCVKK